jgi:hypothetical protein
VVIVDTSKEYIKMCQKAVEIQDIWIPEMYDKYGSIDGEIGWTLKHTDLYSHEKRKMVWLPRQDQLQDMMTDYDQLSIFEPMSFISGTIDFKQMLLDDKTWEHCWLVYVMKRQFLKVWNGKEWE